MSSIIAFPTHRIAARQWREADCAEQRDGKREAQILFFTGVRYSRAPAAAGPLLNAEERKRPGKAR